MLRFTANLSLLFTEVPLINRFALAKANGFNAVEIQFPYEISAQTIKSELDAQQLQLVLFNVATDDLLQAGEGLAAVPEKQAQFKTAVAQATEYAHILKPKVINILSGCCFERKHLTAYQNTFKKNLHYALAVFSPLGIKTVFEAINTRDMPHFIIHNSAQMLDIMTEIKHPDLLMQYDIYHSLMMKENPVSFISQYSDKIGHIQFADYPSRHEPGTGYANFKQLFSVIKSSNYAGWVGAEYNPLNSSTSSLSWLKNAY